MANYKEEPITGSRWTRSHEVRVENPLVGDKAITFYEQSAKQTSDGATDSHDLGSIRQVFDDPSVTFPLLDPTTETPIPGATSSFQDVYVILHSLYMYLAAQRDAGTPVP